MSRKIIEEKRPFEVFILRNDEDHSVEVEELENINFGVLHTHLEHGKSVFIRRKQKPKMDTNRLIEKVAGRDAEGPLKFFLDWLYDQEPSLEQL